LASPPSSLAETVRWVVVPVTMAGAATGVVGTGAVLETTIAAVAVAPRAVARTVAVLHHS